MKIPNTYKTASIKVIDKLPKTMPRWIANWYIDENLNPVILLETYYVEKLLSSDKEKIAKQSLLETLEHEYEEALLALRILKEKGYSEDYIKQNMTGISPRDRDAIESAGGKAHTIITGEDKGDYSYYKRLEYLDNELGIDYLSESELRHIRRLAGLLL